MENTNNQIVVAVDNKPALLRPIAQPAEIIAHQAEVRKFVVAALIDGKDFGVIPGTNDRKVLLKPGAEVICGGFGVRPETTILTSEVDHNHVNKFRAVKWINAADPGRNERDRLKAEFPGRYRNHKKGNEWIWQESTVEEGESLGLYRYVMRTVLISPDGRIIGEGVGSCSTMETKYIRSPRDAENTVLKMATKRAFVAATLSTFGLSDMYTQDVEDMADNQAARRESTVEPEVAHDTEVVEDKPAQQPYTAPAATPRNVDNNSHESTFDSCEVGQIFEAPEPPVMPGGFNGFDENTNVFGYQFPRKDAFGNRFPGWKSTATGAQFSKFFATINFGPESRHYALTHFYNELSVPIGLRHSSAAISMAISFAVNCGNDATRAFKDSAMKFVAKASEAEKRYLAGKAGGAS